MGYNGYLYLDYGHRYDTPGKRNEKENFYEWRFNLDLGRMIKKRAEELGMYVFETNPNSDKVHDIGLTKRATLANNKWNAQNKPSKALFVSVHANYYNAQSNGCETYTATNASSTSKKAAKTVNDCMWEEMRKIHSDFKNRGTKVENFTVIKKASMPSILIETAFYSNMKDLDLLRNHKPEFCEGILKGICKHFGITYKAPNGSSTSKPVVEQNLPVMHKAKVKATQLNIRAGAGTNFESLGMVKDGTILDVVSTSGDWSKVKYGNGYGFANNNYLVVIKEESKPVEKPNNEVNKVEDKKGYFVIVYEGDTDKTIAEVLAWELGESKTVLVEASKYKPGDEIKSYAIGKCCDTVECDVEIQGKNRNETLDLVRNFAKNVG